MTPDTESARPTPNAFISYSWSDEPLKAWVRGLATRLRPDGVDVTLDQWHAHPGDQLPAFMETSIRENDYVLIICTPHYADRSNRRIGGTGYEGDIMTGEVFTTRNQRKFIPVLRAGEWNSAKPSWLLGKYGVDLRNDPFSEDQYQDLLNTLHGTRPKAPAITPRRQPTPTNPSKAFDTPTGPEPFEPIRILNIVVDEVTQPRNDGTRGSALYCVPFQLSRVPPSRWGDIFIEKWRRPPSWTSMHRPSIAELHGDKVYLNGTTMDEVRKVHRDTLVLAVNEANRLYVEFEKQAFERSQRARQLREEHERRIRKEADDIKFD